MSTVDTTRSMLQALAKDIKGWRGTQSELVEYVLLHVGMAIAYQLGASDTRWERTLNDAIAELNLEPGCISFNLLGESVNMSKYVYSDMVVMMLNGQKIKAIKLLRTWGKDNGRDIGLKDAKEAVEDGRNFGFVDEIITRVPHRVSLYVMGENDIKVYLRDYIQLADLVRSKDPFDHEKAVEILESCHHLEQHLAEQVLKDRRNFPFI